MNQYILGHIIHSNKIKPQDFNSTSINLEHLPENASLKLFS